MKSDRHFGVGVVVEVDNKILMVQEGLTNSEIGKKTGMFSIPTGHVESGETVISAAVREVLEETGFSVQLVSIIGFYDTLKGFGIVFKGELTSKEQVFVKNDEIKNVVWMTIEDILQCKLRPAVKEIIKDYESGKSYPLEIITIYSPS